jgi:mycothiol system anti-sigma-R factor
MIFDRLKRALARMLPRREASSRGAEADAGTAAGTEADETGEALTCEETLGRVYEYMDGELDHLSSAQVEEHFRMCARCYPHLRLERNFRARVQTALGRPEVPGDLRERVLDILARESPGD